MVHRAGELSELLSLAEQLVADHRTPDVDSGQSLHLHRASCSSPVDLVVVWADVVDQRQCFEPHCG